MSMWFTLVVGTAVHCSDTPLQDCSWHLCPSGLQTLMKRSTLFRVLSHHQGAARIQGWADVGVGRSVPILYLGTSLQGDQLRVPVVTDTSGVTALSAQLSLCLSLQSLFPTGIDAKIIPQWTTCRQFSISESVFPGNPHCNKNFSLQQDCCLFLM